MAVPNTAPRKPQALRGAVFGISSHRVHFLWQRLRAPVLLWLGVSAMGLSGAWQGLNWSDAATLPHFGSQVLHEGRHPFQEAVYQTGPLPIYLDAAAQGLLGLGWSASAVLGVQMIALWALCAWACLARVLGRWPAVVLVIGLTAAAPAPFHSSWWYADLSAVIIAYAFLRRRPMGWLAGLVLGMLFWCRPHASLPIAVCLVIACSCSRSAGGWRCLRGVLMGATGAWAIGFIVLVAGAGPVDAMSGMLLEAPARKQGDLSATLLDAISAGVWPATAPSPRDWAVLGLSTVVIGIVIWWFRRELRGSSASAGRWLLVSCLAGGLLLFPDRFRLLPHMGYGQDFVALTRQAVIGQACGVVLPYALALAAMLCAQLKPMAWTRCHHLPARCVLGVLLPLLAAGVWHLQMSQPGPDYLAPPGWNANPSVMLAAALIVGGWRGWRRRQRMLAAVLLAMPVLIRATVGFTSGSSMCPWLQDGERARHTEVCDLPPMRGFRMTPEKLALLQGMAVHVAPGDSGFVVGPAPALYDLLGLRNPTRIDTLYPDFSTADELVEAAERLRARPPRWLVVLPGWNRGSERNQAVADAVDAIAGRYEEVWTSPTVPPEVQAQHLDRLSGWVLLRRRGPDEATEPEAGR